MHSALGRDLCSSICMYSVLDF